MKTKQYCSLIEIRDNLLAHLIDYAPFVIAPHVHVFRKLIISAIFNFAVSSSSSSSGTIFTFVAETFSFR
jgi:hypothetical protein